MLRNKKGLIFLEPALSPLRITFKAAPLSFLERKKTADHSDHLFIMNMYGSGGGNRTPDLTGMNRTL